MLCNQRRIRYIKAVKRDGGFPDFTAFFSDHLAFAEKSAVSAEFIHIIIRLSSGNPIIDCHASQC